MTESPTLKTPDSKPNPPARPRSLNAVRSLLVLVFRLLLLGVGGTVATVLGMAIANVYPAQVNDPPIAEKLIQQIETLDRLRQAPAPEPTEPLPSPSASANPDVQAVAPQRPLSAQERQQLQTELRQLKADLKSLGDRTTALENQVGDNSDAESLEARLQSIEQSLNPQAANRSTPPVDAAGTGVVASATSQTGALTVTLPTDALFQADERSLRPAARLILDNVATELQTYPGTTVLVESHTDTQGDVNSDRLRAFEQAKAVQNYLTNTLEDGYHWIVVSYGSQTPLAANDTPANRQRNRRIELTINPL